MGVFAYTAKTADGKKVESVIRAADRGAAQAELKKKNLTVNSIVEQKGGKKTSFFGPPRPHVKTKDIAVMTRQLSTMISAGIPLLESMEILHEQASDPASSSPWTRSSSASARAATFRPPCPSTPASSRRST